MEMESSWKQVSAATRRAANLLFLACDRIELADGKINGDSVDPWTYAAVHERVKSIANLMGDAFKPGASSQVLLNMEGRSKDFDVVVTPENGILLTRRE